MNASSGSKIRFEIELDISKEVRNYKVIQANLMNVLLYQAMSGGFVSGTEGGYTREIEVRCISANLRPVRKKVYE
jgi:hypothetical protein